MNTAAFTLLPETGHALIYKHQSHPERAELAEWEYFKKLDSWKRILGDAWKDPN